MRQAVKLEIAAAMLNETSEKDLCSLIDSYERDGKLNWHDAEDLYCIVKLKGSANDLETLYTLCNRILSHR